MTQTTQRLRAGTGSSEADDSAQAGREAATQAMAALDGGTPALIIVFASRRYDLQALLAAVREVTGDVPLVGETSAGHFRDGELTEPSSGVEVLAVTAGQYRFATACVVGISVEGRKHGARLAHAARDGLGPDRPPYGAVVLLADGLANDQQELVGGVYQVTGAGVPIVGGGAADDRRTAQTFVFHGERVLTDAAVLVWIGSDRPLRVTVGHGWRAVGLPMLVTKVDGDVIREFGARSAAEVFEENVQHRYPARRLDLLPEEYYAVGAGALGLIQPDGSLVIRAVYRDGRGLIRAVEPLPLYSAIQFVVADEDDLLDTSQELARRAIRCDTSVLLVFSCVARLEALAERRAEEARRLQSAAGRVPIFGTYTFGQYARMTGVAGFHNATVAMIAL